MAEERREEEPEVEQREVHPQRAGEQERGRVAGAAPLCEYQNGGQHVQRENDPAAAVKDLSGALHLHKHNTCDRRSFFFLGVFLGKGDGRGSVGLIV